MASNLRSNEEYIAPSKAKAISRLIVTLCSELRGVALQLVRAGTEYPETLAVLLLFQSTAAHVPCMPCFQRASPGTANVIDARAAVYDRHVTGPLCTLVPPGCQVARQC